MPGVSAPTHGLTGHRPGAQVTFDLEALAVEHLPFLVRDADRGQRLVDRGELGGGRLVERGAGAPSSRGPPARVVSLSSIAWASAVTVRCAAEVVSRLAIAARARVTSSRLARDQDVHRVDEDVEVLAHAAGASGRGRATTTSGRRPRASHFAGIDIVAGAVSGVRSKPGVGQGPIEVVGDLLVGARLDHHRHVGVGPAADQAVDLAPDREQRPGRPAGPPAGSSAGSRGRPPRERVAASVRPSRSAPASAGRRSPGTTMTPISISRRMRLSG